MKTANELVEIARNVGGISGIETLRSAMKLAQAVIESLTNAEIIRWQNIDENHPVIADENTEPVYLLWRQGDLIIDGWDGDYACDELNPKSIFTHYAELPKGPNNV